MASRRIEDAHVEQLRKLLSESGLECFRPTPQSTESLSTSGDSEIVPDVEEVEKQAPEEVQEEEEAKIEVVEEEQEEHSEIFPTPSLRRVLPDATRNLEGYNRIHVLPAEFKKHIDPAEIPKIASTAPQRYIDVLAELTGCKEYKGCLAEYWFLDTLANLLRRAQEDKMDRPGQAVLILWFCEWMKEMQHFDAADRERMLRRFKDNMLSAARFIAEEEYLPAPADIPINYKAQQESEVQSKTATPMTSKHLVTFENAAFECSLRDLTKIIHYIFDLFSTDFQYNLVRSVFTFSPQYALIDAPHYLQIPKRIYAPLKPKKAVVKKEVKPVQKGKKKDVDTEEYLALLELRAKEERELEELEEKEREDWNRRSHVLPLSFAVNDAFFDHYWPPPEPEPVAEPDEKPKGKGKK